MRVCVPGGVGVRGWRGVVGVWRMAFGVVGVGVVAGFCVGVGWGCGGSGEEGGVEGLGGGGWVRVVRGDVRRVVVVEGEVEARNMVRIVAGVQGSAVLAELAEEGLAVKAGDVVARFEPAQLEQDLARQEGEAVRAAQELASLEGAELPLELLELGDRVREAEEGLADERVFLESLRELAGRGLTGEGEVKRQEEVVAAKAEKLERLRERTELTRTHLHGARLAKARAALEAAERQRDFTRRQVAACTVRAPVAGRVALLALPIGGEYRTAHVGDALFRNQAFLCLPEAGERVWKGEVGEAELSGVVRGAAVRVVVAAFPDLALQGRVESVGALARPRSGEAAWKKYFPVVVALGSGPEGLPTGLSARAEITTGVAEGVLVVPRAALMWEGGGVWVRRRGLDGGVRRVCVETGLFGTMECEIRAGLAEGEEVWVP